MARQITRKRTVEAKLETIRRKQARRFKYGR